MNVEGTHGLLDHGTKMNKSLDPYHSSIFVISGISASHTDYFTHRQVISWCSFKGREMQAIVNLVYFEQQLVLSDHLSNSSSETELLLVTDTPGFKPLTILNSHIARIKVINFDPWTLQVSHCVFSTRVSNQIETNNIIETTFANNL